MRHGELLDVKERADTDNIIYRTAKFLCPIIELLVLTYSGKLADKYEEAWTGD